jgi:hypothetical protein
LQGLSGVIAVTNENAYTGRAVNVFSATIGGSGSRRGGLFVPPIGARALCLEDVAPPMGAAGPGGQKLAQARAARIGHGADTGSRIRL